MYFSEYELELKNNRKLSFLFILKTRCKAPKENDSSQIKYMIWTSFKTSKNISLSHQNMCSECTFEAIQYIYVSI